jgi:hypothetical protein
MSALSLLVALSLTPTFAAAQTEAEEATEAEPPEAVPTEDVPTEAVPTEAVPTEAVPTEVRASSEPEDGPLSAGRFSLGVPAEVNIIGLAYGVRPEVLYRPFSTDGGTHLRLAVGVLPGPEFVYVPLNVGWRQIFRRAHRLQPHVGAGFEEEILIITEADNVHRRLIYLETGLEWRFMPQGLIGLQMAPSLSVFARPGLILPVRLTFRWDF